MLYMCVVYAQSHLPVFHEWFGDDPIICNVGIGGAVKEGTFLD